jgi:iron complex transport system substrate-binding protein
VDGAGRGEGAVPSQPEEELMERIDRTAGPRGRGRFATVAAAAALLVGACTSGAPTPAPTAAPTTAPTTAPTASPSEASTFPMTVDAGYGAITLDAMPTSVFAWGYQPVDELAVLGYEPAGFVTRVEEVPGYLDTTWPNAVALGEPPSLEQVVALEPDLIISDNSNDNTAIEDVGAPILKIRANDYMQAFDELILIGGILGLEDVAQQYTDEFKAELADTQSKIAAEPEVSVMIVYPGVEPGILGMWLDSSFIGTLIADLGTNYALKLDELGDTDLEGDNANRATSFGLVQLGLEKIVQVNPDVLFVLGDEAFVTSLGENPAWATLGAVANDRVFVFDRDLWSRDRGPAAARLIIEQAREALYPDVFP